VLAQFVERPALETRLLRRGGAGRRRRSCHILHRNFLRLPFDRAWAPRAAAVPRRRPKRRLIRPYHFFPVSGERRAVDRAPRRRNQAALGVERFSSIFFRKSKSKAIIAVIMSDARKFPRAEPPRRWA